MTDRQLADGRTTWSALRADAGYAGINAAVLELMKPDAVVINCARGGLVDEQALLIALRASHR